MIEIAQFGAGRIGQIHAANIAAFQEVRLRYVVDVNAEAAQKLAARYGAKVVSEKEAFADPKVGAVLIASSTDTHARLAIARLRATSSGRQALLASHGHENRKKCRRRCGGYQ